MVKEICSIGHDHDPTRAINYNHDQGVEALRSGNYKSAKKHFEHSLKRGWIQSTENLLEILIDGPQELRDIKGAVELINNTINNPASRPVHVNRDILECFRTHFYKSDEPARTQEIRDIITELLEASPERVGQKVALKSLLFDTLRSGTTSISVQKKPGTVDDEFLNAVMHRQANEQWVLDTYMKYFAITEDLTPEQGGVHQDY